MYIPYWHGCLYWGTHTQRLVQMCAEAQCIMGNGHVTVQLGETPASNWQSLWRLFTRGQLAKAAVQAMVCTQVMVQG